MDTGVVVYGQRTAPVRELLAALERHGWTAFPLPAGGGTHGPSTAPTAAPGLLSLDGESAIGAREIDELLSSNSSRQWIALVPPHCDCSDALGRLVFAQGLHAYHKLPGHAAGLDSVLRHAAAVSGLRRSLLPESLGGSPAVAGGDHPIIGTTPAMQRLFSAVGKTATVDAPVLILGESGTGKELAARSIHERSARADRPFVAVNCAALPEHLIQSELFGHEKGAFTGAVRQHIGRIEAAAGGTLLLDEVGDLPPALQATLLRFLQSGTIQRIGGTSELHLDVRVMAATHVCLEDAVAARSFREDLYHRLNVLRLEVPPLRERVEDIDRLARFYFERFASERAIWLCDISEEALQVMRQHEWPGNVRELINRMRRATVMAEGRLLRPQDLDLERRGPHRAIHTLEEARAQAEKDTAHAALVRNASSVARASRDLGISRVTLYRLIDKYGLRPQSSP